MKKIITIIIIFLSLTSFSQSIETITEKISQVDKTEIQRLIREVLKWADSDNSIDLLPVNSNENDSIYIEFKQEKMNQNIYKLSETDFFSKEFIENYKQIILALDKKLKTNDFEYGPWYIGDMPPFDFSNSVNPWCQCQDNMEWNLVEVEQIEGNEFQWKWGGLNDETHQSWKDFKYKFNVIREDSIWKISFLEGFNVNEIKI